MDNIYLYLGDENLIINNKIERIIKESGADQYNVNYYDLEEVSISDVISDALTLPFISSSKVVVIKRPKFLTSEKSLNEVEAKYFLDYLGNPMSSTILIINAANMKLDERKEIVKKLKKVAVVSESKELTDIEILGWIKRQCSINNVLIKDDAVKTFFNLTGKNLLNAKNEIDKLVAYVGPNGVITSDIINKVVVKEISNDVFALSNAIIEQNKPKIINLYRELTTLGNDVFYLFSLVAKSMRDILFVSTMLQEGYKQSDVANVMKTSSGRAYYLVKNARSIELETVKSYIIKLGNLDYQIKSGQIDPKTGFEFFLFGL